MSSDRNVITWKTAEGTWSVAETDDYNEFEWVGTGYPTADDAVDGYCEYNANPGGYAPIANPTADQLAHYAELTAQCPDRYRHTTHGTQPTTTPRY
jgi:hypothetical protein